MLKIVFDNTLISCYNIEVVKITTKTKQRGLSRMEKLTVEQRDKVFNILRNETDFFTKEADELSLWFISVLYGVTQKELKYIVSELMSA
jgi:hypothetical protein